MKFTYCKNCASILNENDKYCNACGSQVGITDNINNGDVESSKISDSNFEERFIKSYIGDKTDKIYDGIKKSGINIWAILFGIGYFAYRKMYLISGIIVVIGDIIGYLIPSISGYIGTFTGFLFYPIYKWDITRKLKKIKKDNPNANESQLLSIAQNKGGTSITGAIVFFVIYFLIILFI